ncbi:MAG: hypothetical protein HY298_11760 [Verrucomicrobia bacterium]|nr:hypothetical protein [Verrucomicrobiota bacterium]
MKTKNLFLLPALIAVLNLLSAGRVTAQTFTTLHSFTETAPFTGTNSDGATPVGGLITNLSGTTLYGTAIFGGALGYGTVFAINTDGTGFTNLHSFTYSDGPYPNSTLVLSSNILYGTAHGDGSGSFGTVFAVHTDGTGFTSLHTFTRGDGQGPVGGLLLSGNTLYGTTELGRSVSGHGTVFAVHTDGTGFTNLYDFTGGSDGAIPQAGLILSGTTLYGTAIYGGSSDNGTVFAVNTDGTGFTNLHSFTAISGSWPELTNSDGAHPSAGLLLSGNALYGTAPSGGRSGAGTVFAVNTDGTGFTNLHSFTASSGPDNTNSDGANPSAGLILSGDTLYGTAASSGSSGAGTVFALHTDGTGFTTLLSFTGLDGAVPRARLILSGNTLYGTASGGGSSGNGTVFSLSFRPQLTITSSGTNVILSWPISYAGFSYAGYYLEETANLGSPTGWSAADPFPPVIVNGQLRVTRPMLGPQISYRLRKF